MTRADSVTGVMNEPYQTPVVSSNQPLSNSGRKRLTSISPLKAGVVIGALYGILALVMVVLMLPFLLLGAFSSSDAMMGAGVGIGVGLGALIGAPLIYGAMGFIAGALSAFIYNLISKLTGGLEFTIEDV